MVEIDKLKDIHHKMKGLIDSKSWRKANNYMKTIWETGDVNKMNMILILTQSLVNHPQLKTNRYKLYKKFNSSMGWIHLEWPMFKIKDPNVPTPSQT